MFTVGTTFAAAVGCMLLVHSGLAQVPTPKMELNAGYWNEIGESDIDETIQKFNNLNTGRAKNVILFVGDGMSLSTVVAGRIYKGQKHDKTAPGEETMTSLDQMPHSGILKTYSVNYQTPDSAATATAFLCGIKTKSGTLGVSGKASRKRCTDAQKFKAVSVLENAAAVGKATGIVTNTRVQHATPAAAYAKTSIRSWYSDSDLPATAKRQGCKDIASQLVGMGRKINVVLGGGRAHMRSKGHLDEEYSGRDQAGDRDDGRNLIDDWLQNKVGKSARYVWRKSQFDAVNPETTEYLMGLFEPFEMHFSLDRSEDKAGEPSLPEMTEKAIKILQKNDNGFFLLVESGMIDKAHHQSLAHYALEEFLELEKSVEVAQKLTSDSDTLIIVTSDHGHVFTIGGGTARRGNPILGLSPSNKKPRKALDGKYYTTSGYANGPGGYSPKARPTINRITVANKDHQFQAAVPLVAESHSSEDVAAFTSGPMAHMITGVHEQNYIAHMINFAACMGPYVEASHCEKPTPGKSKNSRRMLNQRNIHDPQPWEDPSFEY